MNSKKAISYLGLAKRAGWVDSGEFATENAIRQGKAYLVLVAEDASENTKKKFRNSCRYYEVAYREFLSKTELGKCIGKEYRSCAAVLDGNLADRILEQLPDPGDNEERSV